MIPMGMTALIVRQEQDHIYRLVSGRSQCDGRSTPERSGRTLLLTTQFALIGEDGVRLVQRGPEASTHRHRHRTASQRRRRHRVRLGAQDGQQRIGRQIDLLLGLVVFMFEQRLFSVCQLGRRQVILATSKQEIRIGQKAGYNRCRLRRDRRRNGP